MNIRTYIKIVCIFLMTFQLKSAELVLLKELDFSKLNIDNNSTFVLKLYTNDKKKIGNYLALDFTKLIQTSLMFDTIPKSRLLFICETESKEILTLTGMDISDEISGAPVFLVLAPSKWKFHNVTLSDLKDKQGVTDLGPLEDDKYSGVTLYSNIISKDLKSVKQAIKENNLIFPSDVNTKRWLGNLLKVSIYNIKP